VATPSTIVELGLTIPGDVFSFDASAQANLTASLRDSLSCHEPACYITLRLSAGSVTVSAILTIPSPPARSNGNGSGSATTATYSPIATAVAAAATALVAEPPSTISARLGVAVEAVDTTVSIGTAIVPLVFAPPPPSLPPPPSTPPPTTPPPGHPLPTSPVSTLSAVGADGRDSALTAGGDGGGGAMLVLVGAGGAVVILLLVAAAYRCGKRAGKSSNAVAGGRRSHGGRGSSDRTQQLQRAPTLNVVQAIECTNAVANLPSPRLSATVQVHTFRGDQAKDDIEYL